MAHAAGAYVSFPKATFRSVPLYMVEQNVQKHKPMEQVSKYCIQILHLLSYGVITGIHACIYEYKMNLKQHFLQNAGCYEKQLLPQRILEFGG